MQQNPHRAPRGEVRVGRDTPQRGPREYLRARAHRTRIGPAAELARGHRLFDPQAQDRLGLSCVVTNELALWAAYCIALPSAPCTLHYTTGEKGVLLHICGQRVCSPEGPFWEGVNLRAFRVYWPRK